MVILLDLDGVLITTPPWRAVAMAADGFCQFNEKAAKNLAYILAVTKASIVLTTSHRINYSLSQWREILHNRGIDSPLISKVNDLTLQRCRCLAAARPRSRNGQTASDGAKTTWCWTTTSHYMAFQQP